MLEKNFKFPRENIITIYNEEATRDKILSIFCTFKNRTEENDRFFFFYAGHGYTETGHRGEIGFLVPHEGNVEDLSTLVRWSILTQNAELLPAKHVLYIMDACYGGLAITRNLRPGSLRFLNDMIQRFSRQVLTAGKADEVVSDSGGPIANHSVFTGHLIQALESKAYSSDGILTANGVMAYVYEKVSKDYISNQTPHYGFLEGDGDFIFDGPNILNNQTVVEIEKDVLYEIPAISTDNNITDNRNIVDIVKEYLSEKKYSIKLHDLITEKLREAHSLFSGDNFDYNNRETKKEIFVERIKYYESIINDIKQLTSCLSYWGTTESIALVTKIFSRITDHLLPLGGVTLWLDLRWYPSLLTFYSAGISAIAANKYDYLYSIMYNNIISTKPINGKNPYVLALYYEINDSISAFKLIPGY
jgi:hypothetical protein